MMPAVPTEREKNKIISWTNMKFFFLFHLQDLSEDFSTQKLQSSVLRYHKKN